MIMENNNPIIWNIKTVGDYKLTTGLMTIKCDICGEEKGWREFASVKGKVFMSRALPKDLQQVIEVEAVCIVCQEAQETGVIDG